MSSVYFIKEKNYKLTVAVNSIDNNTKYSGQNDPYYCTCTLKISLNEDSFDEPKQLANSYVTTYFITSTEGNHKTTVYLKNSLNETIPLVRIYVDRDPGEAFGSYYNYVCTETNSSSKLELKGFMPINGEEPSSPVIKGSFTIAAAAPEVPGGTPGEDPDPDAPEDMIVGTYEECFISVTVTDEEWQWLKGINNE